jgi:hypothetical protein
MISNLTISLWTIIYSDWLKFKNGSLLCCNLNKNRRCRPLQNLVQHWTLWENIQTFSSQKPFDIKPDHIQMILGY